MSSWDPGKTPEFGPSSRPNPSHLTHSRVQAVERILQRGFNYLRRLRGHTSCVNALAFSNGEGRWLASGGDDPLTVLWDLHQEDLNSPARNFFGHKANVFALAFSATNQYLYSGDTDNTILRYDLNHHLPSSVGQASPTAASAIFRQHQDSVRAISCRPEQDEVFMSASEDGCIILHDARAEGRLTRAQSTLQHDAEFTGVQFHPTMHHIFATSDNRGQKGIVQTYITTISKPSVPYLCNPEVGSITFDKTGTKLAATMLYYLPTLYVINDPFPVAVFSGERLPGGSPVPSGERSYANACTIKHGSFGGPGLAEDQYYCAGSDDFRAYMWKIPEITALVENREEISAAAWANAESTNTNTVAFASTSTGPRYVPAQLSTPMCRLAGHRSVVNTALVHPHLLHIATAGIERDIILHSPTPNSPFGSSSLVMQAMGLIAAAHDDGDDDDDDDSGTIALFDELLRQEGNADIFSLRRCNDELEEISDSGSSSEEMVADSSD